MNQQKKSMMQIISMCFGFFGIQFGWGLQMANMSAIYERLGASEAQIPLLWLAAPVTGLLVQPIIGYLSDRTWTRLGRRRPYFLFGAIFASIALIIMPYSYALWMAAMMLWILDTSVNVSMEPFRAFVGDLLPPEQRKTGYAMQSLMIGAGAVIASSLPFILSKYLNVSTAAEPGQIPDTVKYAFIIGGIVYISSIIITILTTPETPPKDMQAFEKMKKETSGVLSIFTDIIKGIGKMPKTMVQLSFVQFFTWCGLFLLWIYFGVGIATAVFGAQPGTLAYEDAINWGGVCFATYNGVAFGFSFLLLWLTKKFSARGIHIACLLLGGLGLASLGLAPLGIVFSKNMLLVPMVFLGIAWASILSMPYAMLSNSIPAEKMGFYMGVFNFFIVIPQIVVALGFGFVMKLFGFSSIVAVSIGGFSFLLAALLTIRVQEHH